jgi:hypothetical protein
VSSTSKTLTNATVDPTAVARGVTQFATRVVKDAAFLPSPQSKRGPIFISHHYCESSSYFRLSTIPHHETPPPQTKCFSSPGSIASGRVAGKKCYFERRSGFAASGTNLQAGTRRKCLDGVVRIGKERGGGMDGGSRQAVRWKRRSWDGREMRRGWKMVCLFEALVSSTVAY